MIFIKNKERFFNERCHKMGDPACQNALLFCVAEGACFLTNRSVVAIPQS